MGAKAFTPGCPRSLSVQVRRQRFEHRFQTIIGHVVAGTVEFEILEQQQHLLEMVQGQAIIHSVQRMGEHLHDLIVMQARNQFKNILT